MVAVVAVGIHASPAGAHTPHDTVTGVAFSPTFQKDGRVYVIAASRLLVSEAGKDNWKPLVRGLPRAPEEGEGIARIAISPSDPDTMYVSSRVGGAFRSTDGGRSWRSAAGGLGNPDLIPIAVSPRSAGVVMAAGTFNGLYRTVDGGRNWNPVPGFVRVPAVTFVQGSGRAVVGDASGRVRISDNDGVTWRVASTGQGSSINALAVSSGSGPTTVFAGDSQGHVFRSDDGGTSFAAIESDLPVDPVGGIAISPDYDRDHTLWVSLSERGVYRSNDSGRTWRRFSRGLTTDVQAHVVHVAEFRTIVAGRGRAGTVLYDAGFDGLFGSNDGGRRWRESQTLVDYVVGLDVSPDYAHDRTVAAATYVKGAYLSTDAGGRWKPVDHGLQQDLGAGNKFAPIRRLHNISFSPDYVRDHTIFSAGWTAFLKTTDRGATWVPIQVGLRPAQPLLRQYVLGIAPGYGRRHELYLGTRQGEVFRSARAGDAGSWTKVGNAGSRVRSFAFDPAGGTIFAGTVNGVVRSDDRAATWTRTGPAGESIVAISPQYAHDGTVLAGIPDGLLVSRDRGRSWQPVRLPAAGKVEALALSPAYGSDHTVLVSLAGSGFFRSTNGARSFAAVGSDLVRANHVIADFTNPTGSPIQFSPAYAQDHTVFGYASQVIVRSTDRGETWKVLRLPSAASFLTRVRRAEASGSGSPLAGSSSGGSISKRRVAAIALTVLVVLALIAVLYRRSRRLRPDDATSGGDPSDAQVD